MDHDNPFAPPSANVALSEMPESQGLKGLGGWLILLSFGIVLNPIRLAVEMYSMYVTSISPDTWAALSTPGSPSYIPFWLPMVIAEITINSAMVIAWIGVAVLFFRKKVGFPNSYIGMILFSIAFVIFDAWAFSLLTPGKEVFGKEVIHELGRAAMVALIWIPYLRVSKRVKATFTQ